MTKRAVIVGARTKERKISITTGEQSKFETYITRLVERGQKNERFLSPLVNRANLKPTLQDQSLIVATATDSKSCGHVIVNHAVM